MLLKKEVYMDASQYSVFFPSFFAQSRRSRGSYGEKANTLKLIIYMLVRKIMRK